MSNLDDLLVHPIEIHVRVPGNPTFTVALKYGHDTPLDAQSLRALVQDSLSEAVVCAELYNEARDDA